MKDNFDQYAWNTNRILENEMSDADKKAKQKVDVVYDQIIKDFPECFKSPIEKSSLKFSVASAFTELSLGSLSEAAEEKEYEVEYWVLTADGYDNEYIKVNAKSEGDALMKAKEETRRGKNFKIYKR
mgnify:FL=1|jgi:hypothetical protein|tara:strand:+ start:852 stop:1232 length:381 start_codon:yes stop_codon:yes gene_type:complete